MNYLIKKILLLFVLFVTFIAFGEDMQAGAVDDPPQVEVVNPETQFDTASGTDDAADLPSNEQRMAIMRADAYYELRKRRKRRQRRDFFEQSYMRYSNVCNRVTGQHECKNMCRYIYSRDNDREDCEQLPIGQIEAFARVHMFLESPGHDVFLETPSDTEQTMSIYPMDLDGYFKLSIAAFDRLLGQYGGHQAEGLLLWLVEEPLITGIFIEEDEDEEEEFFILDELFRKIAGDFNTSVETHKPFTQKVYNNEYTLMEVVIQVGNEEALEWFHEYITETNEACRNEKFSLECFTVFCKIGKDMNQENRKTWLEFDEFDDYIAGVVNNQINGSASPDSHQWNTNDIRDVDNDVNDFYTDLCGNLATASE